MKWPSRAASRRVMRSRSPFRKTILTSRRSPRSTDGGVNWTAVTNGLTATTITDSASILPPPRRFTRARTPACLRARTRGSSWTALNAGLTNLLVNTFAIVPGSQTFYVGTCGGGVFRFPTVLPVADLTWGVELRSPASRSASPDLSAGPVTSGPGVPATARHRRRHFQPTHTPQQGRIRSPSQ